MIDKKILLCTEGALTSQVLTDNIIERLPVNLGKLQSLKLMNLDGNRITSLPDECNSSSFTL